LWRRGRWVGLSLKMGGRGGNEGEVDVGRGMREEGRRRGCWWVDSVGEEGEWSADTGVVARRPDAADSGRGAGMLLKAYTH